jgi:YfiH family protein
MLSQVHGTDAHELAGDEDPGEVVRRVGDITLAHAAGVACGVRSADCVPILLAHPPSGAVAAIHSGWRGTVKDAAAAGVQALRARVAGDEPRGVFEAEILAAIGPHIEACCFEVGEDVAASLAACSPLGAAAVSHPGGDGAKPHVDLRRIVRSQLEAAGLRADRVDDVPGCTVCDRASFHSFRRDGARSGRMLSAIVTAAGEGAARG